MPDQVHLFPTPQAHDAQKGYAERMGRKNGGGNANLNDMVLLPSHLQMLPTPTTQDAENNGGPAQMRRHSLPLNALVATPTTSWFSGRGAISPALWEKRMQERAAQGKEPFAEPLHVTVERMALLPTPRTPSGGRTITPRNRPGGDNLEERLATDHPELIGGQLNPDWVDFLMGFPIGWTNLPE